MSSGLAGISLTVFLTGPLTVSLTRRAEPIPNHFTRLLSLSTGPGAIKYLLFADPRSIKHLVSNDPGARYLRQFSHLSHLELNEIQEPHLDLIMKFVRYEELPYLRKLHCNVNYLDSATHILRPDDLTLLEALYDRLRSEPLPIQMNYPKIFFHGLQLDLLHRSFDDYLFEAALVTAHLELSNRDPHSDFTQHVQVTKCSYVGTIESLVAKPRSNLLSSLLSWYPNIRAVSVHQTSGRRPKIDEVQFLDFLRHLDSLVDLDLRFAQLSKTFYSNLSTANYVNNPSQSVVRALNAFTLIDLLEPVKQELNFLDPFSGLRHLHTNLASKDEMILLIASTQWKPINVLRFDLVFTGRHIDALDKCNQVVFPSEIGKTGFFRWTITRLTEQRQTRFKLIISRCSSQSEDLPESRNIHEETFPKIEDLCWFIMVNMMYHGDHCYTIVSSTLWSKMVEELDVV